MSSSFHLPCLYNGKAYTEVETLTNNAKGGCKVDFLKNWLFTSVLEQWLKGTFSILVKKAAHAQWNLYQTEHVHCVHFAVDLYKKSGCHFRLHASVQVMGRKDDFSTEKVPFRVQTISWNFSPATRSEERLLRKGR